MQELLCVRKLIELVTYLDCQLGLLLDILAEGFALAEQVERGDEDAVRGQDPGHRWL